MNISYNWLSQYVEIPCNPAELADKLTMAGIEVEAIEHRGKIPAGVMVAEILERKPHPDADRLSVCRVGNGENELQIVCGASNCDAGKKVPLAVIGTVFTDPETGVEFQIKKSKLRGVESFGMLCSSRELGLDDNHDGLLELPATTVPGTPLAEIFPGDTIYEVEITPNRPDWLSHWGIARDVACLLERTAALPKITLPVPSGTERHEHLVTVRDADLCPRYTARIIRGVTVKDSPEWLKERLLSIGLRPINNIVDITNFILMELGQPLHAFDYDKLAGNRIIVRRAESGEKMKTLDGKELVLAERHLVIADAERPAALAGVMGGFATGVTGDTVNVLLESAAFYPANIRATSRELGIASDSSYRFERGVDWEMVETAGDRAAALILEIAGGELVTGLIDVKKVCPPLPAVLCRFDRIRKLVGIDIANAAIMDIFRKLRLKVTEIDGEKCSVTPPSFRLDISREADLAEEIARINGLDAIPVVPVAAKMVSSFAADKLIRYQQADNELISLGLYQCMHYSTVGEKSALADSRFDAGAIYHIANPLSLDLSCLRPSLFGEMLTTIERNVSRKNIDLRLFETGRVFCADQRLYPEERMECCIVLSGRRHPERFSAERDELFDFYDMKGLIESWFELRRIENYEFVKADDGRFAAGMSAAVTICGKIVGYCGLAAKTYTAVWRTDYPVFMAILNHDAIVNAKPRSMTYCRLAAYPAVTRDVAFIANEMMQHADVVKFIENVKPKYLEKIELFDIFRDENTVGPGRKSMAYTLTFRNPERTLTDVEVNAAFEKLRTGIGAGLGVELR